METRDILVIGSGVAGLTFAIKMAQKRPDLDLLVISKNSLDYSNTSWAQGGIAAVWDFEKDSYDSHIADTLDAGDGLCDPEVVDFVVKEGPEMLKELIEWGARFDKDGEHYDLGMEGGHSEYRILHYKDVTGAEVQRALIEKAKAMPNISLREHAQAVDLITQHHLGYNVSKITPDIKCFGAYIYDRKEKDIETIAAKVTVVASGGGGQIYKSTTNPVNATGDGIAMFYRAKGHLANMEFVQFHPTSLYNPADQGPDFLISEAVRGFGAILKTTDGETFMENYDERKSLAPRDIVARAIDNEMKKRGDEFVYLDCRHLDKVEFLDHFPNIYEKCKSLGIDAFEHMIPVVPACHYMCGGIKIDNYGRTNIQRVFATGECTNSGLHGANRLASNSLLEGLVYAPRLVEAINTEIDQIAFNSEIPEWNAIGTNHPKEMVLITQSRKELREIMSNYVGIVRTNVRLKRAMARLHILFTETEELYRSTTVSPQLFELRNLITIAYLVTRMASLRRESRGLHYTTDYLDHKPYLEETLL